MTANGSSPETEPSIPSLERVRVSRRPARLVSFGLLIVLTIAVALVGNSAVGDGGSQSAVRSVRGHSSQTKVAETTLPRPATPVVHRLRTLANEITTTTAAPTTTTTAPPTTTTTAPPTTTTAPPVTTTTAAPTTTTAPPAPAPSAGNSQSGQATWYRWKAGNCAHNSLPMGTRVTVTNAATGATATCTVGDRGAFGPPTIIDLDASVFEQIAPLGAGRIQVTITW
jgi:rare lipoprotein A (peptidoglycan hydrolase)